MESLIKTDYKSTAWQQQVGRNLSQCDELDRVDREIIKAGCYHPLISSYSDNEVKEGTKQLIIKIGILYGLPPIADYELLILIESVKELYKNYTLEEIFKAAQLNLSGGLFHEKVEPFGKISMAFISNLMSQFLIFRNQAHKKLSQFTTAQKTDTHEKTEVGYRNQDYYNTFIEWSNANNRFPDFWNWRAIYKHIDAEGLFYDTTEQREALRAKIESGTKSELRKKKILANDMVQAKQLGEMIDGNYATNDFYQAYVIEYMNQTRLVNLTPQ